MHLLLVGLSHRTAPVELRERLDFHARGLAGALKAMIDRTAAHEAVIVSTCNRAEVYAAYDDIDAGRAELAGFLSDFNSVDRAAVSPHARSIASRDPIEPVQPTRSRAASAFFLD